MTEVRNPPEQPRSLARRVLGVAAKVFLPDFGDRGDLMMQLNSLAQAFTEISVVNAGIHGDLFKVGMDLSFFASLKATNALLRHQKK